MNNSLAGKITSHVSCIYDLSLKGVLQVICIPSLYRCTYTERGLWVCKFLSCLEAFYSAKL